VKKEITYLAVPYTHKNPKIIEKRFIIVNKIAAILMNEGYHIFSPISHSHPIALAGKLPTQWEYWGQYDRAFLKCSKNLIVLKLDGWKKSTGVQAEIKIAKEYGIPIKYITENYGN
jgi:hypothetical protein